MQHFIGCDAHKKFSVFVMMDEHGRASKPIRVEHEREAYRAFLRTLPPSSEIAVEACGFWYWLVDEMEAAGHLPRLANAIESKKCMGKPHKHDPLDAKGLAILLRNGTLPECWIPPQPVRDQRELLRTRMALRDLRGSLKHRIHGALARYGLQGTGFTDLFGRSGRAFLTRCLAELPPETARMVVTQLAAIDELTTHIEQIEQRIHEQVEPSADVLLLMTVPGVGPILGPVIGLEIADVRRFPRAEQLASYAGLVPRLSQSGEHVRLGHIARQVNQYLKWAFVEAATCAVKLRRYRDEHVGRLYRRLWRKRGHGRAIVAVARHLAEASYWVLTKQQTYRPPRLHAAFVQDRVSARRVWPRAAPVERPPRPTSECDTRDEDAHAPDEGECLTDDEC
jgi:transposase